MAFKTIKQIWIIYQAFNYIFLNNPGIIINHVPVNKTSLKGN